MGAIQPSFDDIEAVTQEAIDRAEEHANASWMAAAERAARHLASWPHDQFTSDDVWAILEDQPVTTHEPRALGAVFRKLKKEKLIFSTGQYVKSSRLVAHGKPTLVWQGLPHDS